MLKIIGVTLVTVSVLWGINPVELSAQNAFEDWKRDQEERFEEFKNEQDAAFMKMLEESWEFIEAFDAAHLLEEAKFEQIPQADQEALSPETDVQRDDSEDDQEAHIPVEIDLSSLEEMITKEESPEQPEPEFEPVDTELSEFDELEISFYHTPIKLRMDPGLIEIKRLDSMDEDVIRSYWEQAALTEYDRVLESLKSQKSKLQLNDWGFAKLIYQTGMEVHENDEQLAYLFSWFMLTQSGYAVRIGYNEERLHLLFAFENPVYATSFFTIGGTRFYAIAFDGIFSESGSLHTYQEDFPDANRKLTTNIEKLPNVQENMIERDFSFEYNDSTYLIKAQVNRNLIDFYEYYPQTNLEVYFNAPVTLLTSQQILTQLGEIIEGKSKTQAANLLLRFSQTAFGYMVDPDNFGREKPLFPEETLYYDYSDCEDRAIMFQFLVSNLLGLDVVGLKYPGHIATAVNFNTDVRGDFIRYNNSNYLIADPTYMYANIGMEMPHFEHTEPEIIHIRY